MKTLNPKLFDEVNGQYILKDDVKKALRDIAEAFLEYLKEYDLNVIPADIRLLGSNAGFDYTDYSDIDLHIVVDFEQVSHNKDILSAAFFAQKSLFNAKHDITVKGIQVELYVEDVKAGTDSEGIYSLLYDKWIKFPTYTEIHIDTAKLYSYAEKWETIIGESIRSMDYNNIQHTLNRLYMVRKNGLETGGRYSSGNLLFKEIRNRGLLDDLRTARDQALSKQLSLESRLSKFCPHNK